ncbi:PREDICTED: deleted in malignant brain tumors 1 protein-like [Branchiostoma belcheri]|uniref:Deleted in malignant brain tumors 1 protein-like n=1 Tax=Branchiostoma belcheri TaxID=7741 RepID=A0A6P5AI43_BRABE|nr:PREDICTED: deleted in malignant brain tumors 1 protein-like [Branchiostoma belcheri]
MADLRCDGNESSLFDCSYAGWGNHGCEDGGYRRHRHASVVCDPSRIRLIGGSGPKEGRVEVRPDDSMTWGTVCHNRFNMNDADVVCRMLGYPNATQVRNGAYFGQGTGPIYMDDLQCDGNETSLFNCSYAGWTIHDCDHGQDVGVVCRTDSSRIRLVGGSAPNEGRVEVRPADSSRWGTVCHNGFDLKDAEVVCRMLGYPIVYRVRPFGTGTGPIYMEDLQCDGTESSLFNCSHKGWRVHDCSRWHHEEVGVVCALLKNNTHLDSSRIRLVGGSSRKEGRVEVRQADSMTWGTVCHNQFDIKDADVVCKMLGYASAQLVRNDAYFGPGRGPIYMDNLRCNGDENSLFNCSYPGWMINDLNCSHDQAAGVECTVEDGSKVHVSSGVTLSVDYDPKTDFMYWYGFGGINRARRDGSGQETIVRDIGLLGVLRLDHAGGNVYWSDDAGRISVARKDGSFVRTLLTIRTLMTLQGSARHLVLDPGNGLMYWVNRPNIDRAAMDGSNHTTIIRNLISPFAITIDYTDKMGLCFHRLMYWVMMYWVNPPTIDRAAMDGSNQTTIIRNLTDPRVITIDYTENRLYYSDKDAIYSSDMLGNNIQLVKPGDGEYVTGIAAGADYIYWTDYLTGEVIRLSKSSRNQTFLVDGLDLPKGIFLSTASPPNVTNGYPSPAGIRLFWLMAWIIHGPVPRPMEDVGSFALRIREGERAPVGIPGNCRRMD